MNNGRCRSLVVVLAALSGLAYLAYAYAVGIHGFPLDDAWIHQTYARNVALHGQWSYDARSASAGSTSPLWTIALSIGYLLRLDGQSWGQALGLACAVWVAWLVARITGRLLPGRAWPPVLAAALCALEWHLVWASLSGMETLLFAALGLVCLERYLAWEAGERVGGVHGLVTGACAGLLVLARPEGLLLLAFISIAFVVRIVARGSQSKQRAWGAWVALGAVAFLVPYLAFNLRTIGLVFPSTFYAKQAEYRIMIEGLSLPARLSPMLASLLAGTGIVLVPGFVVGLLLSVVRRKSVGVLIGGWVIATWLLYALRLPVSYQHARYLIPTLPAYVILAVAGASWLLDGHRGIAGRVIGRAWLGAAGVALLAFWLIGARAYSDDVAFINGEMGRTADWLGTNTPPGSRIAAHDIGLLGFEVDRPLIDLAGLITPEVIPFINDESRLIEFMEERDVDFVVLFPDWSPAYRTLAGNPRLTAVFESGYDWTRRLGRSNMTVYRSRWSGPD